MVKLLRAYVWMTWHEKAKKDAVSGDTLRGVANRLWSGDIRMGEPPAGYTAGSYAEYIGVWGETGRSETSQYPEEKKKTLIFLVAASERETA